MKILVKIISFIFFLNFNIKEAQPILPLHIAIIAILIVGINANAALMFMILFIIGVAANIFKLLKK